jgi:hypothetical protein
MKGHRKYNWMGKGLHKRTQAEVKEERWYYSQETEKLVSIFFGTKTAPAMENYIEVKAKYSNKEFAPINLKDI